MQKARRRANAAKRNVNAPLAGHLPPPAVYALRVWSVKQVKGEWFISPAARFDDKEQWLGPYASVHRATTAIARKLAEEVMRRHNRRCEDYGIDG
jgi:hypothetical protein